MPNQGRLRLWNHERMAAHQPEDRELFETEGSALYEAVLAEGGLSVEDPRVAGDARHPQGEVAPPDPRPAVRRRLPRPQRRCRRPLP